ncbi:MAG: 4'-phosphopantetheinyl transferase superfamily protein [Polyangiales bacterium]|jgi:4'-phosphopantetheinyl transferase
MTIDWLLLRASSLPEGEQWLGPEELKVLAGLRFPKRRSEWKLGRYVAKRALASLAGIDSVQRVQIIAAEDGAPEAFIEGKKLDLSLSISHREGVAACAIGRKARVGCDLEAVEPRSKRFVEDFFTARELAWVEQTPYPLHDRHVALTWSAKESALKLLRVGLRRDTRRVEVHIEDPESAEEGWHRLNVTVTPESRSFTGRWRQDGEVVLTVVSEDPAAQLRASWVADTLSI